MKWRFTTVCFCLLLTHAMARTSAAQADVSSSGWQATVKLESAALYAGVSVSSRVVTLLRRGDTVVISLEITSEGGKWYAVTAAGQLAASGYLSGGTLDVQEPGTVARWEYQPPPEPAPASETESSNAGEMAIAAASRGKIESDIKSFFVSKFGRTLPVSAFGQTRLHSRLGFDHRNGVDVALNPDSAEGRALLGKLRGFGVPFIAFRHAIPGVATGAHIHVGKPSHRK
jgi:hypothetical protein